MHVGSKAGMAPPRFMGRRMRTAAAGGARPIGTAAAARDDNSSRSAWTDAAAACQRACGSCMHVLWGPPRQSGRRRRGARVPSIGLMHPGKCVASAVSGRMQRERVRHVGRQ
jgi:hypothetical protein